MLGMSPRIKKNLILMMLAVLGATSLAAYSRSQYTLKHPNRNHAETELTKNMKATCLGRFLIDIPSTAEYSIGTIEMGSMKIEYIGKSPSEQVFLDKIKKREAELRASKHDSEGTRLRETVAINSNKQRIWVYRGNEFTTGLSWVETFVKADGNEWKISFNAADEDVPEVKSLVTRLASELLPRNMLDVPNIPGACISNGLIKGSNYEAENYTAGIRLKNPDITISIKSETSGPRERGQTMLDRVDRANKLAGEVYNIAFKPIRRAELTVDSRKGQEYVSVLPDKDIENFNAKAEVYGDATPKSPTFKIEMDMQRPLKPKADDKIKTLTNEDALALWDAVIKSIRPRPGAF